MFVVMARSRRLRAARKSGLFILVWALSTAAAEVPQPVSEQQRRDASRTAGEEHVEPGGSLPRSGQEEPLAAPSRTPPPVHYPEPPERGARSSGGTGGSIPEQNAPEETAPGNTEQAGASTGEVGGSPQEDVDPRALTEFRGELAPYGRWVEHRRYGTLWVPHRSVVGAQFSPYVSHGFWGRDARGQWIWVSDLPFGHVVFHYGRWIQVEPWGWAWVPGAVYAPAWVVWRVPRRSDTVAYVGWAPAPPSFFWYGGVAHPWVYPVTYGWVFCPSPYVFHRHMYRHLLRDRQRALAARDHTREHAPAAPRSGPPRSPTPAEARVPRGGLPAARTAPERVFSRPGVARRIPTGRPAAPVRDAAARAPAPRATAPGTPVSPGAPGVPRAIGLRPPAALRPGPPRQLAPPPPRTYVRPQPAPRPPAAVRPAPRPHLHAPRPAPFRGMPRPGRGR
jgi:hypothetical protein